MNRPNLFIVGAMRCGTSSLFIYLNEHPEVFMPEVKEPMYFGSDLYDSSFPELLPEYLCLFKKATNEKIIGEASTTYLYSQLAAKEIKAFSPQAKIIIMLRNPVDMMYSLYSQSYHHWRKLYNQGKGYENIADFSDALKAEAERKQGRCVPGTLVSKRFRSYFYLYYRDLARYTNQVQRFFDVFDSENIKVIIFEDLIHHPCNVYQEVCRFLNIDSGFHPNFKAYNQTRISSGSLLEKTVVHTPAPVRHFVRRSITYVLGHKLWEQITDGIFASERPPNLDPGLRKSLQEEFKPEVVRLGELIGRDLRYWCHT